MNKLFQIFILLIIIALTTWAVWKPARAFLGFNSNEIKVSAEGALNIDKIVIEKGNFSINRASDRELFTSKNEVIFDGQPTNPVVNGYGENDFLVKYADSCYFQFRHFKTSNNQRDTYRFRLYSKDHNIHLKTIITGTDPMEIDKKMNPIILADSLVCNVPLKDAGAHYNMTELQKLK